MKRPTSLDYLLAFARGFVFLTGVRKEDADTPPWHYWSWFIGIVVFNVVCQILKGISNISFLVKLGDFGGYAIEVLAFGLAIGIMAYGSTGEIMLLRKPGIKTTALLQKLPSFDTGATGGIIGTIIALIGYRLIFGGDPFADPNPTRLAIQLLLGYAGGSISYFRKYYAKPST